MKKATIKIVDEKNELIWEKEVEMEFEQMEYGFCYSFHEPININSGESLVIPMKLFFLGEVNEVSTGN